MLLTSFFNAYFQAPSGLSTFCPSRGLAGRFAAGISLTQHGEQVIMQITCETIQGPVAPARDVSAGRRHNNTPF
jgi:hypothetical protein